MTTDILYMIFGWAIWVAFIAIVIHHKKSMKKFYNGRVPFGATMLGRFFKLKSTGDISTPNYYSDPKYQIMSSNIYYRK